MHQAIIRARMYKPPRFLSCSAAADSAYEEASLDALDTIEPSSQTSDGSRLLISLDR